MKVTRIMSNYRKGAENVPLRDINKNLPILVLIYNLHNNDELITELRLNYGSQDDRKHLGRITYWALTNHCTVETIALSDANAEIPKQQENEE
jgi:hypothetical protein